MKSGASPGDRSHQRFRLVIADDVNHVFGGSEFRLRRIGQRAEHIAQRFHRVAARVGDPNAISADAHRRRISARGQKSFDHAAHVGNIHRRDRVRRPSRPRINVSDRPTARGRWASCRAATAARAPHEWFPRDSWFCCRRSKPRKLHSYSPLRRTGGISPQARLVLLPAAG